MLWSRGLARSPDWQTKTVISPLLQCSWLPNLSGWWLTMRGSHLKSHHYTSTNTICLSTPNLVGWCPTLKFTWPFNYCPTWNHVTILKIYNFAFTRHMDTKLDRILTWRGSFCTQTLTSSSNSCLLCRYFWTGWQKLFLCFSFVSHMTLWLRDQRDVTWHFQRFISSLSQYLWPLNLARY